MPLLFVLYLYLRRFFWQSGLLFQVPFQAQSTFLLKVYHKWFFVGFIRPTARCPQRTREEVYSTAAAKGGKCSKHRRINAYFNVGLYKIFLDLYKALIRGFFLYQEHHLQGQEPPGEKNCQKRTSQGRIPAQLKSKGTKLDIFHLFWDCPYFYLRCSRASLGLLPFLLSRRPSTETFIKTKL